LNELLGRWPGKAKSRDHECDGLLNGTSRESISRPGAFKQEWANTGTGLKLYLYVSSRMAEEPQTIVISARMQNGELLCGNIRVCDTEPGNDCINVPHTASCGLTPKLSRIAARSWQHGKLHLPC
jgi:hypothetical protein